MFMIMAAAMKADIKDALAKWMLVTLADYANDEAICWPSIETLAKVTGMGTGTVSRKLALLIDLGFIERIHKPFTSTRYRLLLPQSGASAAPEWGSNLSGTYKTPKRASKMQVPEGWQPSAKLIADIDAAREANGQEAIDHEYEASQFCDFHRSKGNTFKDFDLAYRGWCRRIRGLSTRQGTSKARASSQSYRGYDQSDRHREYLDSIG